MSDLFKIEQRSGTRSGQGDKEFPLPFQHVYWDGQCVGHAWPSGALVLIVELSDSDKALVEVGVADHFGNGPSGEASQASTIEGGTDGDSD